MKRYYNDCFGEMDEDEGGMYVLHSDHLAAMREKDAEIERLTECLKKANSNAEEFERKWYLAGDEVNDYGDQRDNALARAERAEAQRDELRKFAAFLISCVKCGEPWTATCEREFQRVFLKIEGAINER